MGLFSFLTRKKEITQPEKEKTVELPAVIPSPSTMTSLPLGKSSDYLKHAVGWVYSCVNAIANYIAAIPIHLYKRKPNGDVEEILNHELLDLLYKVNPFTTKFDHFWSTTQYLELAGEAPWFLQLEGGKPTALLLLRPDRLQIKHGKDQVIDHYKYKPDISKNPITIAKEELILLKYPDPENIFRGRGTLRAAVRSVDLETYSEEYNIEFFKNSARPDIILTTEKDITQSQADDLRAQWNKKYRGEGNKFKMAILTGGLKHEKLSLSQKDMDFLEQQRFTRDKILSIFGCPKSVVGISDDVNRANAEAGNYSFARWTIRPKIRRIIEQLNEFLVPFFGQDLFLDFEDPVPEDVELKYKRYENALKNGWMTINEVRELEGLEPIDGGDQPMLPMTLVPVGTPPEEGKKGIKPKYHKEFARIKPKGKSKKIELIDKTIKKLAKSIVLSNQDKPMTPEERWWRQQIKIADHFEALFISRLRSIFRRQEKEILKKMGVKKANIDVDAIKIDVKKEAEVFIEIFSPILRTLIREEGDRVLGSLGVGEGINITSSYVNNFLKTRTKKFSKMVNKTTNERIRKQLIEGLAEGEGMQKLGRRVNEVFKKAKRSRAVAIARSETMRATNFAAEQAYKQSGIVQGEQWLTEFDERTCPYCMEMNGKIVKLEENFFEKGDKFRPTGVETPLEIKYGNVPYPPLHTRCRCTTIPVLKEKAIKKDGKKAKK